MDNTQLARCLQSVGKQVFVRCFWPLRAVALGRLSRAACAQTIINQGHGTELTGALLRISRATAIFEAGRERDAIDLVLASSHPAVRRLREEAEAIRGRLNRLRS